LDWSTIDPGAFGGYLLAGNQARPISAFPKTIIAFADPVFSADDPRVSSTASPARPLPAL